VSTETLPYVSSSAGTARVRVVSVPAFSWVHRSSQIRDFLLLYRDLATSENNTWAEGHLDHLLEGVVQLEARAKLAWRHDIPRGIVL